MMRQPVADRPLNSCIDVMHGGIGALPDRYRLQFAMSRSASMSRSICSGDE